MSNLKHGMRSTSEYTSWCGMRERCYKAYSNSYKYYGDRGITVCKRWISSFENFYEDMGKKPSKKHSIDRIDNNGNYEPNNCRWADRTTQSHNRRMYRNNTTGINGIYKNRQKLWCAVICVNSKNIYLGSFDNLLDAACARISAENRYW